MPDTPSITINKDFSYRGRNEIWSNTYHFSGTVPTNDAGWAALAAAIVDQELSFLNSGVKYRGYLGYEAGNEFAVSQKDLVADAVAQPAGRMDPGSSWSSPSGDQAGWVRWATPDRTSRGKRIYLRKFFHGVGHTNDVIPVTVRDQMKVYAGKMTDGTLPGGFKVCGPQGAVAGTSLVSPNIGMRQLKRRGKRPSR